MGLDTTHDCWHGPYSAFHRWRKELARVSGLPPLELMEGFWTGPRGERVSGLGLSIKVAAATLDRFSLAHYPEQPGEDLGQRPGACLLSRFDFDPVRWDALRPDPLHILLRHSDCDGEIAASDCAPIADSLERLLPAIDDSGLDGVRGKSWRKATEQFIAGLRLAASRGEAVEFR